MRRLIARTFAYVTGGIALLIVTLSAISGLAYAALHRTETLVSLGTSTLQGIGVAIGGCLGSALLLRFKSARRFIKGIIDDVSAK